MQIINAPMAMTLVCMMCLTSPSRMNSCLARHVRSYGLNCGSKCKTWVKNSDGTYSGTVLQNDPLDQVCSLGN